VLLPKRTVEIAANRLSIKMSLDVNPAIAQNEQLSGQKAIPHQAITQLGKICKILANRNSHRFTNSLALLYY
jgi:hypothetical protein